MLLTLEHSSIFFSSVAVEIISFVSSINDSLMFLLVFSINLAKFGCLLLLFSAGSEESKEPSRSVLYLNDWFGAFDWLMQEHDKLEHMEHVGSFLMLSLEDKFGIVPCWSE